MKSDQIGTVYVGWEYEVPLEDVQECRQTQRSELEAHYYQDADVLSDLDVARFLIKVTHPSAHYLRSDVAGLMAR